VHPNSRRREIRAFPFKNVWIAYRSILQYLTIQQNPRAKDGDNVQNKNVKEKEPPVNAAAAAAAVVVAPRLSNLITTTTTKTISFLVSYRSAG
jgi:hypothetical protein